MSIQDENTYLRLRDTGLFSIKVRYPDGAWKNLTELDGDIRFYPAPETGDNKARLEFQPEFPQTGNYALTAQAKDASGNAAGKYAYQVSFEIIRERMISNVFNYPNPFSQATQFVYTLTGDRPPDFFSIQIMTVAGRIVREITQDEIGPLKIGTHRTAYSWDGTDEFGDRLANGVYLYRVVAKDEEGKDFEKYDNNTGRFFEKGFGKLVILR